MLKLKNATTKPSKEPVSNPQVSVEDLEFEAIYAELKTANASLEAFSRVGKLTSEVANVSIEAAAILEVLEQAVGGGSSSISESISEASDGRYTISTEATEGMIGKAAEKVKEVMAKLWAWVQKQWSSLTGKNKENIEKAKDLKDRADNLNSMSFKVITEETEERAYVEKLENGDYRTSFLVTMLFEPKVLKGMVNLVRTINTNETPSIKTAQEYADKVEAHYREALKGLCDIFGTDTSYDLNIDGIPAPYRYLVNFTKPAITEKWNTVQIDSQDHKPASVITEIREGRAGRITDLALSLDAVKDHLSRMIDNIEVINNLSEAIDGDESTGFGYNCFKSLPDDSTTKDIASRLIVSNAPLERLVYTMILKDFVNGISVHLRTMNTIIKDHELGDND